MQISPTIQIDENYHANGVLIRHNELSSTKMSGVSYTLHALIGVSLISLPNDIANNFISSVEARVDSSKRIILGESSVAGATFDLLKIENLNKIGKLKELNYNWNGNGAEAFTSEEIELFERIINALNIQPQIAPTGKGSLFIQYEDNANNVLAFDVSIERVEKVFVPQGVFANAETEVYTEQFVYNILQSVNDFYGY